MTNHEKRIYALEQNLLKMLRVIEVMQKHQITLGNAIQDLQSAVQQITSSKEENWSVSQTASEIVCP
jgi:hypothetical protein